jgi:hypothetical protein
MHTERMDKNDNEVLTLTLSSKLTTSLDSFGDSMSMI